MQHQWPGYQHWSCQIPTRDFRSPPGPITRASLAKSVAKSMARFIIVRVISSQCARGCIGVLTGYRLPQEHKGPPMEYDVDPIWLGPGKVELSDLVLVRLDHVCKACWQPQFQLIRPRS